MQLTKIDIEKELLRREGGYHEFVKRAWHTVNGDKLIDEKYVAFLCTHMEKLMRGELTSNRLLINIPPGHTKSMTCVVFALAWLWTLDPSAYSIFAHKDQSLARDMARKTRQCITSSWYQERWGKTVKLLDDASKIDRFSNTAGGGRVAVTVRQQITGAHAKGEFGGLIVIDDPDRPDDSDTDTEAVQRWYREVLPTRFSSLEKSQICIVQQRISQRDLSGYVLDREEGYTHVNLPMEFDPARKCITELGEDWRTEEGEILSPLRNSAETIARLKNTFGDPRIAHAQLNQNPVFASGNIFKAAWFDERYKKPTYAEEQSLLYGPDGEKRKQELDRPPTWFPRRYEWTLSCDLTFSGKNTSDYAVIQAWARCLRTDRHYLDDQFRKKMDFVETTEMILGLLQNKYRNATVLIEKAGNGFAVIDTLQKAGVENVEEFSVGKKSKEARADAVSWFFSEGKVLYPADPDYDLDEYIRELTGFPALKHDDQVDSTTMYLAFMAGDQSTNLANAFKFAGYLAGKL